MNRTRKLNPLRFAGTLAIASLVFTPGGAHAQEGYPVVPDPALCQIQPRTLEDLTALFATATPVAEPTTPVTVSVPTGNPADQAAITGITTTIQEAFACLNGNQYLSFMSLITDRALLVNFSWFGEMIASGEIPDEFLTPEPQPAEYLQTILSISGVSRLTADGRVGAFVVSIDPSSDSLQPGVMFLILTQVGERWLVDEVIEFS